MPEMIQKRGKKGSTFFIRYSDDDDLKSTVIKDAEKYGAADILLAGKMTVLPPSLHPETGAPYTWVDRSLLDLEFPDLPVLTRRKLDLIRIVLESQHAKDLTTGHATHDPGMRLAAHLVHFGCRDTEIEQIVRALLPLDYSGNSLDELPEWITSARKKGFDHPVSAGGKRSPSPTQLMMAILDGLGVTFCHDRLGHAFMTVPQEGAGHLTFNLAGRGAAEILARAFYRGTGQGLRQAALDDILALLKARALHDGPQEAVFARVARQADRSSSTSAAQTAPLFRSRKRVSKSSRSAR
jgi:hypothetical protein